MALTELQPLANAALALDRTTEAIRASREKARDLVSRTEWLNRVLKYESARAGCCTIYNPCTKNVTGALK